MSDSTRRPPSDFTPWRPRTPDVDGDNTDTANREGGTADIPAAPTRSAPRMAPRMAPRDAASPTGNPPAAAPSPGGPMGSPVSAGTERSDTRARDDRSAAAPAREDLPAPAPAPETTGENSEPLAAFIDSSAIVALVDQDDSSHQDAVAAYRGLVAAGYRLFTSNYVVTETYDLLRTGVGHAVARQWLRDSRLAVYHADEQDERRARRLVLQGRGARGMTITDAVSLVIMERFGVADAFAVDPNFLSGGE